MGLLSFIFGGGKSKAPPPKPTAKAMKPAAKAAERTAKPAEKAAVAKPVVKPAAGLAVLRLKASYAAAVRAGEHRKAYEAACELASLYKRAGARALAGTYRSAADARFAKVLGARTKVVKRGSLRLVGEAKAGMILAHRDFLAGFKKRAA